MLMSYSATAPTITLEDEERELEALTEQEREELKRDLDGHNTEELVETEQVMQRGIGMFNEALMSIADAEKMEYLEAVDKAPLLVAEESPAEAFLRCERFDAWAAARRCVEYWKTRMLVFGPVKAFLPLTLTLEGALVDDVETHGKKYMSFVGRDKFDRAIVYFDRTNVTRETVDRDSMLRCMFYVHHIVWSRSVDFQRTGLVVVANAKNYDLQKHYDRILMKRLMSIAMSVPVRTVTIHICTGPGPSVVSLMLPTLKAIMPQSIRQRVVVHSESNKCVLDELEARGIKRSEVAPFFQV